MSLFHPRLSWLGRRYDPWELHHGPRQPRICESPRVYPCVAYWFCRNTAKEKKEKKKKKVSVLISFLGLICELIEKSTRRTFRSSRSKSFLSACGVVARHHLRSFNPTLVAVIWTSVRLQLFFKASHSILTRERILFVASVVLQDFIRSRYNRSALYLAVTLPCL